MFYKFNPALGIVMRHVLRTMICIAEIERSGCSPQSGLMRVWELRPGAATPFVGTAVPRG